MEVEQDLMTFNYILEEEKCVNFVWKVKMFKL